MTVIRTPRSHLLLLVVLPVLAALPAAALPSSASRALAATSTSLPPGAVKGLALPHSTFPAGVKVRGGKASNAAADAASDLHTDTLAHLGRQAGYVQTARWKIRSRNRRHTFLVTLRYQASIYASANDAQGTTADARASLWEVGRFIRVSGLATPTFAVSERGGYRDVYILVQQGQVASELKLQYPVAGSSSIARSALWLLWRADLEALRAAQRVVARLGPGPQPAATSQPVYVSSWGTGPVVKSPSLMVLDPSPAAPGTALDPGMYRTSPQPRLAARALATPSLVTSRSLARYVRTATLGPTAGWYDAAAIYSDPQAAGQAFQRLVGANRGQPAARPIALPLSAGRTHWLATVDAFQAWKTDREIVLVLRFRNVVTVLAQAGRPSAGLVALAGQVAARVPSWLHNQKTQIVNAAGDPVRLTGLNWYGADQQDFVVGGLDYASYQTILQQIQGLGYNSVRLPFSNELVEQNPVVTAHVRANPELAGLHALDILDRIVGYAGALGLSVILDNHRSEAGWSAEENGLWYTPAYPDAAFVHDWTVMARRYAVNDVVIGVDLRNEPHGQATWGDGNQATDWHLAAQRAGNAALAANPHLLIMVEGVQHYGDAPGYWWGGNLMGVATAPIILQFGDGTPARSQLVYSVHDYGPNLCGSGCPWFNSATTYDSLAHLWDQYWGYIMADPNQPYAAPVWVGEFGTCNQSKSCVVDSTPGSQGQWFSALVKYIAAKRLSWTYWPANGTQSTAGARTYGDADWYGLFTPSWTTANPWLEEALRSIQGDGSSTGQSSRPRP